MGYNLRETIKDGAMIYCPLCGEKPDYLSDAIGECPACAVKNASPSEQNLRYHESSRRPFGLPFPVPDNADGISCRLCGSECTIAEGQRGFCGIRENRGGKIFHAAGSPLTGIYDWYFDPLPTNCVADWVCPGGTGAGYPTFAYRDGPEYGYKNLAVFMGSCSFNCLFCQNSSYKALSQQRRPAHTADHLPSLVGDDTACICFFGGDPSTQMPFVIRASEKSRERKKGSILRICLETNGCMNIPLLRRAMDLIVDSGGCIKFDLKAYSENLFRKLTGQKRAASFKAFEAACAFIEKRPEPPPVVASTLLVPGYVDHGEVAKIARFIASLDAQIPYSLLGFYPRHMMKDLPRTTRQAASDAQRATLDAGLANVRIGNVHLLW